LKTASKKQITAHPMHKIPDWQGAEKHFEMSALSRLDYSKSLIQPAKIKTKKLLMKKPFVRPLRFCF
jgi:hypothetical protein